MSSKRNGTDIVANATKKTKSTTTTMKSAMKLPKTAAKHAPNLLSMPGEICNKIYEYALATDEGLACNSTVNDYYHKPMLYVAGPEPQEKDDIMDTYTAPVRTDSPTGTAEASTNAAHAQDAATGAAAEEVDSISEIKEFNQLKYVCKKMYTETAGLELRLNIITFLRNKDEEASPNEQFLKFVKECTPASLSWPLRIQLKSNFKVKAPLQGEGFPVRVSESNAVADLCRKYPSMKVYKALRQWRIKGDNNDVPDTSRKLVNGIHWEYVLRGLPMALEYVPIDAMPDPHGKVAELQEGWGGKDYLDATRLPNIRYVPDNWLEGFDRDNFLDEAKWSNQTRPFMATEEMKQFWADKVESWYEEGI